MINKVFNKIRKKSYSETILIIDDSIVIREQLKDIFLKEGYHVITASNTKTSLEKIENDSIDLIILDVELNSENGIDFLEKNFESIIKNLKIPVIMISSTINTEIIRRSIKAGAVDTISKPYIEEEIVLKVNLWIDYRRKQNQVRKTTKLLKEYESTVNESFIVSKTNPKGIITYVNEQFCKLSGYSKEELIGKNHNIIRHPETPKELFKEMWHTIKLLKKPWKGLIKNRKRDGSFYWVDSFIKPILNSKGEIVEFIGIKNDVTEQENAKEYFKSKFKGSIKNLNRSITLSSEYEKAINVSNIVSRTDLKGIIIYVNDKFCEISGYEKNELIGKSHNIIRHQETPNEVFKNMWETIKKGKVFKTVLKNRAKDGGSYWVDTAIVPIKDERGQVIEYMGIRKDVTELFSLHEEMEETQKEIIYKMGEIGESRSKETGNHVKRVAEYSRLLAFYYGLSKDEIDTLFTASPMHDIGKVGIPDEILKKPGKLTDEEFELMKTHAIIGYDILKTSQRKVLKAAAIVSKEHHEKWDGKGYPFGLKGEEIHIFGRITALADVFDALGSKRCYKEAWRDEEVFKLIKDESGKHFDPKLVEIFFKHKTKFLNIRNKYKD